MADNTRELVQIAAGEDANSVRDRLSFLRGKRVLLVWPEEGRAITRKLDLVLIQREAMRRAIRLAIVTHDEEVIKNARELNISTFETIGASERGRWKRGRSKVFTNRNQRPKDQPEPEDLMEVASRVRIKRPSLSAIQSLILRLVVLALLIGVVGAVAYVIIPGASVRIALAQQSVQTTVEITINTDPTFTQVDIDNAIIPALRLTTSLEDTAVIPTTGQVDLGDERARGSVLFINDTESPVEIPTGTVVSTSAGQPISFRTSESITLNAGVGEQAEASIEAILTSAGSVGNVAENLINTVEGPLENSVTVRNLTATTGGVSRLEPAVTELDRTLALAAARQQLQERAFIGLSERINANQILISETLNIINLREDQTAFSHEIGDITPNLSITMRADVEAMVIDEQIAQSIVLAQMASQIPRGRALQPESVQYERGAVTITGETITITMTGTGTVTGRINNGQLQEQLAGRSIEDATAYLLERVDLAEGIPPRIQISPDWFNRMPILPIRITIITQQVGTS